MKSCFQLQPSVGLNSPQHLKYVLSTVQPYNLDVTNILVFFLFFFLEKKIQPTSCPNVSRLDGRPQTETVDPCGFEFLTGCLEWLSCFSQITKRVERPGKKNCSGLASLTFSELHWLIAIVFCILQKKEMSNIFILFQYILELLKKKQKKKTYLKAWIHSTPALNTFPHRWEKYQVLYIIQHKQQIRILPPDVLLNAH